MATSRSWRADNLDMRVMVGMSGGVDSTVAAHVLLAQGYDVQGLTMQVWGQSPESTIQPAFDVCQRLGIKHHVIDLRDVFYHEVVDHLLRAYAAGTTPNPCVRCNRLIKFGRLLDHALALGAGYFATGHYARIIRGQDGRYQLHAGLDASKDQSYFLYTLTQDQLAHTLFPLGGWQKEQVRAYAQAQQMAAAQRTDSQDICFVPQGDYRSLLREHLPESIQPGPICNSQGRVLGQHAGLAFYTIGQRSGLGIAASEPLYVIALDVEQNRLIVGYAKELGRSTLVANDARFISGDWPPDGEQVQARIRYRARPATAHIWALRCNTFRLEFKQPLRDITPGQSVVIYKRDQVLGGGIITASKAPQ